MLTKLAILTLVLSACSADPGAYFEDVPDEAALSAAEQAELPDGFEDEHHDHLAIGLAAVQGGYVADAFVATGSDGQVAPTCP